MYLTDIEVEIDLTDVGGINSAQDLEKEVKDLVTIRMDSEGDVDIEIDGYVISQEEYDILEMAKLIEKD